MIKKMMIAGLLIWGGSLWLLDDSATVKRYYKEKDHYRLQPENDAMEPIITDHVDILGKVIGLLRMM